MAYLRAVGPYLRQAGSPADAWFGTNRRSGVLAVKLIYAVPRGDRLHHVNEPPEDGCFVKRAPDTTLIPIDLRP